MPEYYTLKDWAVKALVHVIVREGDECTVLWRSALWDNETVSGIRNYVEITRVEAEQMVPRHFARRCQTAELDE